MRVSFFIVSMLVVGILAVSLGFIGLIYPLASLLLIIPVFTLFWLNKNLLAQFNQLKWLERWLLSLLLLIWASHLIQVFVPETGFDAVWYHLPIAKVVTDAHQIRYIPELYQSLNPLFSDLFFVLGFQLWGDFGSKLVAYFFGLSLVLVSYSLARNWLDRSWSLVFAIIISTFQVIAWQSASFYVDIAKAFWEISALWWIFGQESRREFNRGFHHEFHRALSAGLSFGASLASKLFSFLLWPVFLIAAVVKIRGLKNIALFVASSVLVPLPFYLFAFVQTGNPFYSISVHLQKISEIGNSSSVWQYLFQRTLLIPTSIVNILFVRDYIAPLLLLCGILILLAGYKKIVSDINLKLLLLFVLNQWLVWWFVPPLSTRYALSGFIILLLVILVLLQYFYKRHHLLRRPVILLLVLTIILNMIPRLLVNYRSLKFLISGQPKQIYLEQFYDGWIDHHLDSWHQVQN